MKNTLFILGIILTLGFLVSSCKDDIPKCNDTQVEELIVKQYKEHVIKIYNNFSVEEKIKFIAYFSDSSEIRKKYDINSEYWTLKSAFIALGYMKKVQGLSDAGQENYITHVLDSLVTNYMLPEHIYMSAIVNTENNNNVKSCNCGASVIEIDADSPNDSTQTDVDYSVQNTLDNKVLVTSTFGEIKKL